MSEESTDSNNPAQLQHETTIGDLTEKCGICRRPKGDHWLAGAGKYQCPQVTYFTPCEHQNQRGSGAMGTDGAGWSDTTCSDCGTRFVIGKPPQAEGERNG